MSNPFGDEDDYTAHSSQHQQQRTSTPTRNVTYRPHQSGASSGANPFGDPEDESDAPAAAAGAQSGPSSYRHPSFRDHLSTGFRASGNLGQRNPGLSSSRGSISSSHSDTTSVNSTTNLNIGNYSLGDGSLQKEGLLCPNCLVEFKTITELMRHSEKCFGSTGSNGQSGGGSSSLTPASGSSADLAAQMGVGQIKDFLTKFMNKPKQGGFGSGGNSIKQDLLDPFATGTDMRPVGSDQGNELFDPVQEWKYHMVLGPKRNHMEQFRKIREARIERYVFETNKLLIRLDKLLRDYPPLSDPVRRREHEQSVVAWIDETIVSLCPSCASKFNIITRHKHHCRLCGAVMCTKCSEFIDFDFARRLITPVGLDGSSPTAGEKSFSTPSRPRSSSTTSTMSTTSNLGSALRSLVGTPDPAEMADKIRVCLDCKSLLEMRNEKLDIAYSKPPIVAMYAELNEYKAEIDKLLPVLFKMSDSLNVGETTYNLKDANDLKLKLSKLGEKADLLSRKILILGVEKVQPTPENPTPQPKLPPPRQHNLQKAIRQGTIGFIRKALLGLPELPDEKRFAELRARHEELIQKRIAYEKELVLREQQLTMMNNSRVGSSGQQHAPFSSSLSMSSSFSAMRAGTTEPGQMISIDEGFCPQTSSTELWKNLNEQERAQIMDDESDPMVQQMSIIRSYIRLARKDHRYEEVSMLEENLKELEIEYFFKQQQQQQPPQTQPPPATQTHSTNQQLNESSNPFGEEEEEE